MLNLVFLGIQGSGKGTQARLLEKRHGFKHISMGELLRSNMKKRTSLGQSISKYMLRGELVPDEYIFPLIEKILQSDARGIIFDGFPRTIKQAEFMEERIPVNYAIFFDLDDDIAMKRLTARRVCRNCNQDYNLLLKPPKDNGNCDNCGGELVQRNDDHQEAIQRRIDIFHEQTKPLIDFFQERDKLVRIEASAKPEEIYNQLINRIKLQK